MRRSVVLELADAAPITSALLDASAKVGTPSRIIDPQAGRQFRVVALSPRLTALFADAELFRLVVDFFVEQPILTAVAKEHVRLDDTISFAFVCRLDHRRLRSSSGRVVGRARRAARQVAGSRSQGESERRVCFVRRETNTLVKPNTLVCRVAQLDKVPKLKAQIAELATTLAAAGGTPRCRRCACSSRARRH